MMATQSGPYRPVVMSACIPAAHRPLTTTSMRRMVGWLVSVAWVAGAVTVVAENTAARLDFNRDIRPILSDRCFQCHGPDENLRQGELRLDEREAATAPAASGNRAIVPGDPGASELVRRIHASDPEERMPPAETPKSLSAAEIEKLTRWIEQGAEYSEHWAFVPPRRPEVPAPTAGEPNAPPLQPIDAFIQAQWAQQGLSGAPEADRETLIRRVTLDLTGLPPTLEEVDAFLHDAQPNAYERVVDRLLASPHFGERMALQWLDAARFADTNGYHLDNGRDMTRWRAWVIDAYNNNLPFDQFTIEQLAGDLLPEPTVQQKLATGFNRNHMINFEGGAIPEEYQTAYVLDRVNTTGTVWLGLTIGCAQCHDHKYDPISQREYYQLYAFFNNVPEKGLDGNKGNATPMISLPTPEQRSALEAALAKVKELEEAAATQQSAEGESAELKAAREAVTKIRQSIPTSMVMDELSEPRVTHMLKRGQYDQLGDPVEPAVPVRLGTLPPDAPRNRLGLAQWLVAPEHPLVARVIVNRYWQMLFGEGLVRTAEDFGSQGSPPSHPQLLDWLACEYRESSYAAALGNPHWNTKALLKQLVMSATYRQDSRVTPASLAADPGNQWLARGPRFRLQAEFIRDQALAVSGLLNHRIGGPSVNPYQPAGLWRELSSREDSGNWTAQDFEQSRGEDLYRRSMYTFWKRTCPPPQMATFDAPDREICTVQRARTNTPLQALILLNDPTYVEAARKLAERVLREAPQDAAARCQFLFRTVTARSPNAAELQVLLQAVEAQQQRFAHADPAQRDALLAVGEAPADPQFDRTELAAWTLVASSVLNLDETVTRR